MNLNFCQIYCPVAADILPCNCSENGIDNVNIQCSLATTEDDIEQAFTANFPLQTYTQFILSKNDATLTELTRNLFNGISFQNILIQYTSISSIDNSFFDTSYDTLISLDCTNNLVDTFPFDNLSRFTSLETIDLEYNNLTSIPKLSSSTIQRMNFYRNSISSIADFAFSNCTALELILLYDNQILELPPSTFIGATSLKSIVLQTNRIGALRTGVFSGLPDVRSIYVQDNPIISVDDASFVNLPSLEVVDMSYTKFTTLKSETFSSVPRIYYLDLAYSLITTVEPFTFVDFQPTEDANIHFEYNAISTIATDAFTGIIKGRIYLFGNNISVIETDAFKDFYNSTVRLYNNQISTLDESWLRSILEALNGFDVTANPLDCGCDLLWLFQTPSFFNQLINYPSCSNGTLLSDLDSNFYINNC